MTTSLKVILGLSVLFIIFSFGSCSYVFGVKNTVVEGKNGIEAQYQQNQNNLATYTNKIMEIVQVPTMAKNHIKEVATAVVQGRYGKEGPSMLFKAISENNDNSVIPPSLYTNIQQAMESGRDSFAADQKMLIDKCNVFRNYYGKAPQSFVIDFFNYRAGFDETKCNPVITDDTAKAFETKRSGPLQIQ